MAEPDDCRDPALDGDRRHDHGERRLDPEQLVEGVLLTLDVDGLPGLHHALDQRVALGHGRLVASPAAPVVGGQLQPAAVVQDQRT